MARRRRRSSTEYRVVNRLSSAKLRDTPMFEGKSKAPTESMRKGNRYENKVANLLHAYYPDRVIHGPWIEFTDANGFGVCQPDMIILPEEGESGIIVVECKLTYKPEAERKLKRLYAPLVKRIYGEMPCCVQICKHLKRGYNLGNRLLKDFGDLHKKSTPKYSVLNIRI